MSAVRMGFGHEATQKPEGKTTEGIITTTSPRNVFAVYEADHHGTEDLRERDDQEPPKEEETLSVEESKDEDGDFSKTGEDESDPFFAGEPFLGKGLNITWLWMSPEALVWCLPASGQGLWGFPSRNGIRSKLELLFQAFERDLKRKTHFPHLQAPAFFRQIIAASYLFSQEGTSEDEEDQEAERSKEKSEKSEKNEKSNSDKVTNDLDLCGIALWGAEEPFMEAKDLIRGRGTGATDALPVDREYLWLQKEFALRKGVPLEEVLHQRSFLKDYLPEVLDICNDFRHWVGGFFEKAFGSPPEGLEEYFPPLVENTLKKNLPHWRKCAEELASKKGA